MGAKSVAGLMIILTSTCCNGAYVELWVGGVGG